MCSKLSTPTFNPSLISSGRCAWATTFKLCLWASSTIADNSSNVIWSWSINLIRSTPAFAKILILFLASFSPLTPHLNSSVPGYGFFCTKGPLIYIVGPGIFPELIISLTSKLSFKGPPKSLALVTPAISNWWAEDGMITSLNNLGYVLSQYA